MLGLLLALARAVLLPGGTHNDDAVERTLTGTTSASSIKLGTDLGTVIEPRGSGAATVRLSISLQRVGP